MVNTALQFSTTHGFPKSLVITSSRPNEGKSTTSISIARNLARLNRTVLLIDGDLRKPSLHQTLGLHNRVGFSTALVGNDAIADLFQDVDVAGLSVMTAGPLPPNPAELLSGDRLQRLLELIGVKFEHIVIDGPPVLGLADAPLLGSHVKNIVFLAEAHKARLNVVRFALRRLVAARAHVLGVVLTKFEPRRSCVGYGDDYGYAYVYRYGTTPTAEVDAADGLAVAPHRKT